MRFNTFRKTQIIKWESCFFFYFLFNFLLFTFDTVLNIFLNLYKNRAICNVRLLHWNNYDQLSWNPKRHTQQTQINYVVYACILSFSLLLLCVVVCRGSLLARFIARYSFIHIIHLFFSYAFSIVEVLQTGNV